METYIVSIFMKTNYNIMLDSGAFSFFVKSKKLGNKLLVNNDFKKYLKSYIEFIYKFKNSLEVYVNLDVIGNAKLTWEIQKEMEKNGLNPLPVFHANEDIKYLKKYLDMYEYVGLGGKQLSLKQYSFWVDTLFKDYICHKDGIPRIKVHGFGINLYRVLIRYPWYSVDSTTWMQFAKYGTILFPSSGVDNNYKKYEEIGVSKESMVHKKYIRHIQYISVEEKKLIEKILKKEGFNLNALKTDYEERGLFNAWHLIQLGNTQKNKLQKVDVSSPSIGSISNYVNNKKIRFKSLNLYIAGNSRNYMYEEKLYARGVRNRLFSFFYVGNDSLCSGKKALYKSFKKLCGNRGKDKKLLLRVKR